MSARQSASVQLYACTSGGQVKIIQQISYLVVFPYGYVRILLPIARRTVIFVTRLSSLPGFVCLAGGGHTLVWIWVAVGLFGAIVITGQRVDYISCATAAHQRPIRVDSFTPRTDCTTWSVVVSIHWLHWRQCNVKLECIYYGWMLYWIVELWTLSVNVIFVIFVSLLCLLVMWLQLIMW